MNYYLKRIGMSILVFVLAITFAFVLFRSLPGDIETVVRTQLISESSTGQNVDRERINQLVETYANVNPDEPLHVAYFNYLRDVILYQDFGTSIWQGEPVFDILFDRMPWTIFLSVYGLVLGRTTSLLLGATMAYREGSRLDSGLTAFTILNRTVPYYIIAIILLILFSYMLPIFPSGGRMNPNTVPGANLPFILGVLNHAALPILSTFVAGFGGALAFRGNCIREMGEGYLRVARLRGVSEGRLIIRYVGRNALLPVYTALMMGIAGIFSSGVILETIFNYPGVGMATYDALTNRDYPLLMGAFVFYTTLTLLGVLIADLTYGVIDPRVKGGGERESF